MIGNKEIVDAYFAVEAEMGGLAVADADEVAEAVAQRFKITSKDVKSAVLDHLTGPLRAG